MTIKLSDEELAVRCAAFDENYKRISARIAVAAQAAGRNPADVRLLAATKTVPVEVINHALTHGITLFGENRVQEYLSKYDALVPGAQRHFIGHLQTNKVRQILDKVDLIESVGSVHLAQTIAAQCRAAAKAMPVLIEVNIGREASKTGFFPEEIIEKIAEISAFDGILVQGLMAIPPVCEHERQICAYFEQIYKLFVDISSKKMDNVNMMYLSMGMSGDFEQAIAFGSNIVRIGTALFGARNYN